MTKITSYLQCRSISFIRSNKGYSFEKSDFKNETHSKELNMYHMVLYNSYKSLLLFNTKNLSCNKLHNILKKVDTLINLSSCSTVYMDDTICRDYSKLPEWIISNPGCAPREKWESYIDSLVIRPKSIVQNISSVPLDKTGILSIVYDLTVTNRLCEVTYTLQKQNKLCDTSFVLEINQKDCRKRFNILKKETNCDITFGLYKKLISCNIVPEVIKKVIDCGLSWSWSKKDAEPCIVNSNGDEVLLSSFDSINMNALSFGDNFDKLEIDNFLDPYFET